MHAWSSLRAELRLVEAPPGISTCLTSPRDTYELTPRRLTKAASDKRQEVASNSWWTFDAYPFARTFESLQGIQAAKHLWK
jgi:hypothetical protein